MKVKFHYIGHDTPNEIWREWQQYYTQFNPSFLSWDYFELDFPNPEEVTLAFLKFGFLRLYNESQVLLE